MPISRPLDKEAFDRWLRLSLREQHADAMHEQVPDSLLMLLREQDSSG